jgi:hypothetical protein
VWGPTAPFGVVGCLLDCRGTGHVKRNVGALLGPERTTGPPLVGGVVVVSGHPFASAPLLCGVGVVVCMWVCQVQSGREHLFS